MKPDSGYDLIVIGAGQGGGPLAGAFAREGKRVALVERAHVGGTCINEGCTPTKTMIASGRVAHMARRSADYGVESGSVAVDMTKVRERKRRIVTSFRGGSEKSLAAAGVELIRGSARLTGPRRVSVDGGADADHRTLKADIVVIDTGLTTATPQVDGLSDVPYLTSTSIMELGEVPDHLAILGGGYVGLEFAQLFRRLGSRVTVIQRSAQLLPREDADVAGGVRDILVEDGITVLLAAHATGVSSDGGGVRVEYTGGEERGESPGSVVASHLLIATGRTPNTSGLGLDAAAVVCDDRGFITVNERLETSAEGVYAIGDVNGGPAFTHISYDDFRILRTNLLGGGGASTAGRVLPYTVFTDPQLGRIGVSERDAEASGVAFKVARLPMTSVARALETGETRGFMKAIVDTQTGRILGAAVLGTEGGEIASLIQVAMMGDLHYGALRDAVFSHPTLAESLNNLFTAMDRQ